ncbi:unnamed protein product [Orchesella dallaii]|uniref:Odorant receptor n=1 Tax=Orchesella dallaii TaxID=48710 RepID=A0ABP1RUR9_9HEXA
MKYSHCTFFQWDKTTNRICIRDPLYILLNLLFVAGYGFVLSATALFWVILHIRNDHENGIQDVWDVAFQPRDKAQDSLMQIIRLMYVSIWVLLAGVWGRMLYIRKQHAEFLNIMINYAERQQEKYGRYLERYNPSKPHMRKCEAILFGIFAGTTFFPFLYGFLIFQPVIPENTFLTEVFEVKMNFDGSLLPLILMLTLDYGVIEGCEILFMADIGGVIYYDCCAYWTKLLEPIDLRFDKGEAKFTCRIGCVLTFDEMIEFYREQEILERLFNNIYGHIAITSLHASSLSLWTLGCYVCIRHSEDLLRPGFQMAPTTVVLATVVEYLPMVYAVEAYDNSCTFLKSMTVMVEKEKRATRKILKYSKHFRPLELQVAYPYYMLNRENFLAFINQGVDILVNLLVSIK